MKHYADITKTGYKYNEFTSDFIKQKIITLISFAFNFYWKFVCFRYLNESSVLHTLSQR